MASRERSPAGGSAIRACSSFCHFRRFLDRRDDLLCGIEDVVGGNEREAAFGESLLASLDVVAFETNDERNADVGFAGGIDDPMGDDVAVHDAAENIDQDAFDVLVAEDDSKGCGDLFLAGSASHIEEIGRLAARILDDVHRRHGQPRAVDQAGDIAIKSDIVEAVLGSRHFAGILLRHVAHRDDLGLPVKGVVVEVELGVEGEQLAFRRHDERIDFHHGTIALNEKLVEVREELGRLVHQRTGEAESRGNLARLIGHEPESRIHADTEDLFRCLLGDRLDVHSAFRAGNDHRRRRRTIEQDGEVQLAGNVDGLPDKDLSDLLAVRAGLMGDQHLSKHSRRQIAGLQGRITKMNASLETRLERSLAATSRMDLGLDDNFAATLFRRRPARPLQV